MHPYRFWSIASEDLFGFSCHPLPHSQSNIELLNPTADLLIFAPLRSARPGGIRGCLILLSLGLVARVQTGDGTSGSRIQLANRVANEKSQS
jgi:hypothetical protein